MCVANIAGHSRQADVRVYWEGDILQVQCHGEAVTPSSPGQRLPLRSLHLVFSGRGHHCIVRTAKYYTKSELVLVAAVAKIAFIISPFLLMAALRAHALIHEANGWHPVPACTVHGISHSAARRGLRSWPLCRLYIYNCPSAILSMSPQ